MAELTSLPGAERQRIARQVIDDVQGVVRTTAPEAAHELRRRAQGERWKLISRGQNGVGHVRLAAALLSEQWARARIELSETAAPIRQILAERRLRAIEAFLRENLPHELPRSDS